MCVYNGEKYLAEQLESIICQTLPPDEVNIYDDCSTDSTFSIISEFIKKHNLSNWHIKINKYNKGWRLNFYDALSECDGDYIFFCDQDDIWYPNKISTMIDAMNNNPEILVLNGLYDIINQKNEIVRNFRLTGITQNVSDYSIHRLDLYDNIINFQNRIGAAMLIRKIIKGQLLFFERNNLFAHDLWAINISSLMGGCYWINFPAIHYRIHDGNSSVKLNIEKRNKEERIKNMESKYNYCNYLYNGVKLIDRSLLIKHEYDNLKRSIKFFKLRVDIIKHSKIYLWFSLFPYFTVFIKYLSIKYFFIELLEALGLRDKYQLVKSKMTWHALSSCFLIAGLLQILGRVKRIN
jgi:glycosyltransferase involved in cell wall biosynthesis